MRSLLLFAVNTARNSSVPLRAGRRMVSICILLFCTSVTLWAQQVVTGKVSAGGAPLPDVTVTVDGSKISTRTNDAGVFTISAPPNAILLFTHIGYAPKKVPVPKNGNMAVQLETTSEGLGDVVVVGYGTTRKADLISSVGSISGKDLTTFKSPNAANSLQGEVPGVRVLNGSNGPGQQPNVYIRGVYTIQGSSQPLLIVDGVPISSGFLNSINPDDIERMDVLKDASAAAIYGAQAASGVIVITTKKGKAGSSNLSVTVNYQSQTLKKPFTMAGSTEWLKIQRLSNPSLSIPETPVNQYDTTKSTDWWGAVIKSHSPTTNVGISYTGGSEKAQYGMSLSYTDAHANTKVGDWKRITGRFTGDFKVNDWLRFGGSFAPRYETWISTPVDFLGLLGTDPITPVYVNPNLQHIPASADPTIYDAQWSAYGTPYGSPGNGTPPQNYVFSMNLATLRPNQLYGIQSSAFMEIQPIKNLTFRTTAGANVDDSTANFFIPRYYINANNQSPLTKAGQGFDVKYNWVLSNVLTYKFNVADRHHISALIGQEAAEQKEYYGSGQRVSADSSNGNNPLFAYEDYLNMDLTNSAVLAAFGVGPDGNSSPTGGINNAYWVRRSAYFGRLEYNYDGKYYLTANGRRDGNSKFPLSNQYAFFPSVSLGWRLSAENFMKSFDWMNNLMLKARWGKRGNADAITRSTWYSLVSTNSTYPYAGQIAYGTVPTQIGNPNLKWETDLDRGLGLDGTLFNNKLNFEFEYFNNKSSGAILTLPSIPLSAGQPNSPTANVASIGNKGWEFTTSYIISMPQQRLRIIPRISLSHVKSTYLSLGSVEGLDVGIQDSYREEERFGMAFTRMYTHGQVGAFYGYKVAGIFKSQAEVNAYTDKNGNMIQPLAKPGDFKYVDVNGDGTINTAGDRTFLGDPYPKLNMDFSIKADYKGFDLMVELYGSYGQKVANTTKRYMITGDRASNVIAGSYDKVWRVDNPNAANPNPGSGNNYNFSSWYIEDGSFTRIRNLQIGYTFPFLKVNSIKSVRIYVGGQNLATFTKYKGFNPEVQSNGQQYQGVDRGQYPVPKSFNAGVSLGL
ncbi:MAG TPA: SusC/RagA family TonB-linked outer membrane protein [Puia sp.]|nr:SusC/RagA family TonB-linked outer membrane protein [Puia sp.]